MDSTQFIALYFILNLKGGERIMKGTNSEFPSTLCMALPSTFEKVILLDV